MRHQMRLHLGPAFRILGQRAATAIVAIHQIDHRQVQLAVIDRPMDQPAPPMAGIGQPIGLRMHLRPEQPTLCQRLMVKPLRHRILQPGRNGQVADDLAHHVILDLAAVGGARQLIGGLRRIGGHLPDLGPDRIAGFVHIDGQELAQRPVDPARDQIFHRQRIGRAQHRAQIRAEHLDLGLVEQPVAHHFRQHIGQRGRDQAQLLEIAPGDQVVLDLAMIGVQIAGAVLAH